MIVLGLDPGIARTGFGLIEVGRTVSYIRCGCLTTPPSLSSAIRLQTLGEDLTTLIQQFRPERAVVESIYFGANSKTAIQTAEARGVLIYVLRQHHIEPFELTPLQIKSRLTGYGAADKRQIQHVVTRQLHLDTPPQPDDAADALAAALCVAEEPLILPLNSLR